MARLEMRDGSDPIYRAGSGIQGNTGWSPGSYSIHRQLLRLLNTHIIVSLSCSKFFGGSHCPQGQGQTLCSSRSYRFWFICVFLNGIVSCYF